MSKYLFGLLLAGAAAPALAVGGPHDRHHNDDNSPRQESHSEHPARSGGNEARPQPDRPQHAERPQFSGERPQFAGRPQSSSERPQFVNRPQMSGERPQFAGRPQVQADTRESIRETQHARPVMRENPYAQGSDSVRNWRPREQAVQQNGYYQQRSGRADREGNDRDDQRRVSNHGTRGGYVGGVPNYGSRGGYVGGVPRQGTQPPLRYERHRDSGSHWNTNWRHDRRYDWRDRRRHNRSLFHIGFYSDPFGWGYQSFSIGWRLWPNYYQQSYWIDPAMYGLPYPPPGMQWVRYYNDALLVDTFSGEVVDSIPGFFW